VERIADLEGRINQHSGNLSKPLARGMPPRALAEAAAIIT
jgi:hypothetical protein